MSIERHLLAIIGSRLPAIYDVLPRGPQDRVSAGRFSEVMLNPQPLPPHELGASVAAEFIHVAWLADRFGLDAGKAFEVLDDWCPTKPRKPKLPPVPPWWWSRPLPPFPGPHPNWYLDFHLGFAARVAVAAEEFEGTPFAKSLDKAVARSLEAIGSIERSAETTRSTHG